MLRMLLLGGASLEGPSGAILGRAGHQHRLALLALLAAAGKKGCTRDKLVALLWPESDASHGRHRLSDSLYVLRQALDEDPAVAAGELISLNPDVLWVDVQAFVDSLQQGDREAAVRVYGGPFLDGFHLGDSAEFEAWVEAERTRLAALYVEALDSLASQAMQAGDADRAADWWKQLLAADPYCSPVVVSLMEALAVAGDPANAIQSALAHERFLRDKLDMELPSEVRAMVERLRSEETRDGRASEETLHEGKPEHEGGSQRSPADRSKSGQSLTGTAEESTLSTASRDSAEDRPGRHRRRAMGLAALSVVVVLAGVFGWLRHAPWNVDQPVVEFYLDPPASVSFAINVVLSPDGRRLVAETCCGEGSGLYQRMVDARGWEIIPGAQGAYVPFFSPDGDWLGFWSGRDRSLKKVSLEGGPAQTIVRLDRPVWGASWGPDNTVVFSTVESASGVKRPSLYRVSADGGALEQLTTPDTARGEVGHTQPHYLSSGVVLFTAGDADLRPVVAALSLESGRISRLAPGMSPRSDRLGRVVYVTSEGTAVVQMFNPHSLTLEGSPMPVAEGIAVWQGTVASYSVARGGSLVYLARSTAGGELLLANRAGQSRLLFSPGVGSSVGGPRFSPSGDRIAFVHDEEVWVHSLAEGTSQRLTFDGPAVDPAWTTDGTSVCYSAWGAEDGASASLYIRAADGTGSAQRLLADDRDLYQVDFAPGDSEVVVFSSSTVFRAPLGSDSGLIPLMDSGAFVEHPALSSDGHWLAYKSNESGVDEVYVRSYPEMGPPTVVSVGGGAAPAWSADSGEIYYWGRNQIMVASVRYDGSRATIVDREALFSDRPFMWSWARNYDVHPNGQDFVMVRQSATRAVVRLNALAEEG